MKKHSRSQNKPTPEQAARIAELESKVKHSEENGNPATIWHEMLERESAALDVVLEPEPEPAVKVKSGAESDKSKETK